MAYRYDETTTTRNILALEFSHDFTDEEWQKVIDLANNAEVKDGSEWIYSVCSVIDPDLDPEDYL